MVDAYKRLSKYTVLPLENTIYGPVNETLDCLFTTLDTLDTAAKQEEEEDSDKPFTESKTIVAALDLPISHCLVVKKGTKQDEIRWVRSHEQASVLHTKNRDVGLTVHKALGQSAKFLDGFLPNAKRIPTASTALAAQSLFTESEIGAALCSRSVVDSNPDLEIMHEGTQDQAGKPKPKPKPSPVTLYSLSVIYTLNQADFSDNYTRFVLLVDPMAADRMYPPDAKPKVQGQYFSHFYVGPPAAIAASVPNLGIQDGQYLIASIHSRPYRAATHSPQSHRKRYPQCVFWEVVSDSAEIPDTGDPDYWIGSAPTSVGPPR